MIASTSANWLIDLDGNPIKKLVPGEQVIFERDISSYGIIIEVPMSSWVKVLWATPPDLYWFAGYFDGFFDDVDDDWDSDYWYDWDDVTWFDPKLPGAKGFWNDEHKRFIRDDKRGWRNVKQKLRHTKR